MIDKSNMKSGGRMFRELQFHGDPLIRGWMEEGINTMLMTILKMLMVLALVSAGGWKVNWGQERMFADGNGEVDGDNGNDDGGDDDDDHDDNDDDGDDDDDTPTSKPMRGWIEGIRA